ncbi:MAG: HNH endonuclease [Firmicutes bacterium]|nr:HNH endonuclease [Bacillota bacterium]
MVLVQNKDGKPLSPCHPARARILLKQKKAKVVSTYPFAIKLSYQVENPKFTPTRAILDDGKTCGLGVTQENNTHNLALCKAEMKIRGEEISDNLKNRKTLRAQRRNHRKKRRGREGKIKIRHRKHKEYPLSIRADVEAKVNAIKRLMKMYPITEIVLEPVKLDIVKEINPDAKGKDYQQGLSFGIEATSKNQKRRKAILKRDNYQCLHCGAPVTEETAHIHHFVQRKHGGSKRYDILGTLCKKCHTSVVTGQLTLAFNLDKYPDVRAAGMAMHGRYLLESELKRLNLPVTIKYGYETKELREKFNLPKSHANDAVVLGCNPDKKLVDRSTSYLIKLHPPRREEAFRRQPRRGRLPGPGRPPAPRRPVQNESGRPRPRNQPEKPQLPPPRPKQVLQETQGRRKVQLRPPPRQKALERNLHRQPGHPLNRKRPRPGEEPAHQGVEVPPPLAGAEQSNRTLRPGENAKRRHRHRHLSHERLHREGRLRQEARGLQDELQLLQARNADNYPKREQSNVGNPG